MSTSSTNHHIRAVFFDFDGTLVDSERLHYECWMDAVGPYGGHITWPEYYQLLTGRSDLDAGRLLLTRAGLEPTEEHLTNACQAKTRAYLARFLDELRIEKSVLSWIRNTPDYLHIGVVTSSGEHEVAPVLVKYGIYNSLSLSVYGNDVTNLKPDPEPYLLAIQRATKAAQTQGEQAITKEQCLAFEDSEAGISSAVAAGLRVVEVGSPDNVWGILVKEGLAG